MQPSIAPFRRTIPALLLAGLLFTSACNALSFDRLFAPDPGAADSAAATAAPRQKQPALASAAASQPAAPAAPCTAPACAGLVVMQSGRPAQAGAAAPAAGLALPNALAQNGRWVIDTGTPSPDGQWVAYTSLGAETGGPVLLQNVHSGQWVQLIEAINAQRPDGQAPLAETYWWDVIGWFPDSARLLIGPADLSQVMVVELATYRARAIAFPGGGRGGRLFVDLAPDGSRFIFIKEDAAGNQVISAIDLKTGRETELLQSPRDLGALYNPRFSPDQQQIAYLVQAGPPDAGAAYAIHLLAPHAKQPHRVLVQQAGLTVPVWSPDGRSIAFTRGEASGAAARGAPTAPQPARENIWVVQVADGEQAQVTFLDGPVRSPVWAPDGQSLAFVTQDGQVALVDTAQPGKIWQAAAPAQHPELTSAFFLP